MKVAFLHARQDPKFAHFMLASVRRHMPAAELVHLTDEETPGIDGCRVVRGRWCGNPMLLKMRHLSDLTGDVLALDTDVIVQADLSPVFYFPFDVALTWRDGPIWDQKGNDLTKIMPINCGVMFSRNPAYWAACLAWCARHDIQDWYADQLAVANVRGFDVLRLHCDNFNHTPLQKADDVSGKYAVHYKGKRKEWML